MRSNTTNTTGHRGPPATGRCFQDVAREEFQFLQTDIGFRLVSADNHAVRFETETVYVEILYDAGRSFELGVCVGLRAERVNGYPRPFYLDEILRFQDASAREAYASLHADSEDKLRRHVGRLADMVRRYGVTFLNGDPESYERLSAFRQAEGAVRALKREVRHAKGDAMEAWKRRDHLRIVQLLGPVSDFLTPSDRKRLDIARKSVKPDDGPVKEPT